MELDVSKLSKQDKDLKDQLIHMCNYISKIQVVDAKVLLQLQKIY